MCVKSLSQSCLELVVEGLAFERKEEVNSSGRRSSSPLPSSLPQAKHSLRPSRSVCCQRFAGSPVPAVLLAYLQAGLRLRDLAATRLFTLHLPSRSAYFSVTGRQPT